MDIADSRLKIIDVTTTKKKLIDRDWSTIAKKRSLDKSSLFGKMLDRNNMIICASNGDESSPLDEQHLDTPKDHRIISGKKLQKIKNDTPKSQKLQRSSTQ